MKINLNLDKIIKFKNPSVKVSLKQFKKVRKSLKLMIYFGLLSYISYRQFFPYDKYKFIYSQENMLNNHVVNKLSPISYRETIYLTGCFLQMIYNEIKSSPNIPYTREFLKLNDGGCIALDWYQKDYNKTPDKVLVILHGLTGGSESTYCREIVDEFSHLEDMRIVVVNYRGIAESPLLTPRIYHVGFTEDLHSAMVYIRKLHPDVKCYALGTSMGANIFSKFLSKHYEFNDYIKGFISISNPLNCLEVEKRNRGFIIDYFILRRQINYIKKHHRSLEPIIGNISY
jgi:predicted alpha/beta-fold hydrolase